MSFSNVRIIHKGNESRVLFDSFTEQNDKNPNTGKAGVRCRHWFTAFFLRIVGKIEDIKTSKGNTIHLDKDSLRAWRKRHQKEMNIPGSSLPTISKIIANHKEMLDIQAEKEKLEAEKKASSTSEKEPAQDADKLEKKQNKASALLEKEPKQAADEIEKKQKQDAAALEKKQTEAATILQKNVRGFVTKSKFQKLKNAVTVCQSNFRGMLVRKEFEKLKSLKKEMSAVENEIKQLEGKIATVAGNNDDAISCTKEAKANLEEKVVPLIQKLQTLQNQIEENIKEKEKLEESEKQKQLAKKDQQKESDNAVSKWFKSLASKLTNEKEEAPKDPEDVKEADNIATLNLQIAKDISKSNNLKEEIRVFNSQIEKFKEDLERLPKEKEKMINQIQGEIAGKKEALLEKNKEYDALIIKMNSIGQPAPQKVVQQKKPALSEEKNEETKKSEETKKNDEPKKLTKEEILNLLSIPLTDPMEEPVSATAKKDDQVISMNPYETLLADVGKNSHQELAKLIETMFTKFEKDAIKKWDFDPKSGKFTLIMEKPGKLWVQPRFDNGKADPKTPKGVVLLLGNNSSGEVQGRLDGKKNLISFSKGFDTYCKYKKKITIFDKEGIAKGNIKSIQFSPKKDQLTFVVYGEDTSLKLGSEETEIRNLGTVLKTWSEGEVPTGDHEQFLLAKK